MLGYYKKFIDLCKYLIFSKKVWSLPPKNDIIILDRNGSQRIIDLVLGHNECSILDDRKETINVPIFIISIFNYFK